MAENTSSEDILLLETMRLKVTERPPAMNRYSGKVEPISDGLQDWAITAPKALKDAITTELEVTRNVDSDSMRRRVKLGKAFGNALKSRFTKDSTQYTNAYASTNAIVGELRASSVSADGKTVDVPTEVSDMSSDLRTGQLEAQHRQAYSEFAVALISHNLNIDGLSEQNVGEIQRAKGWAPILQSYPTPTKGG